MIGKNFPTRGHGPVEGYPMGHSRILHTAYGRVLENKLSIHRTIGEAFASNGLTLIASEKR